MEKWNKLKHIGALFASCSCFYGTDFACLGFVGFPSVGKSTLLTNLAGVYSEVAAYEFTTLTTVPGVIRFKGAKIQLLDLPGIIEGAKDGKGRGKQVCCLFILALIFNDMSLSWYLCVHERTEFYFLVRFFFKRIFFL